MRAVVVSWALAFVGSSASAQTAIQFREMLSETGVAYRNVSGEPDKRYIVSSLGSGVALFDYDEDGDLDVYFVNGSAIDGMRTVPAEPNRLYRNDGEWRFVDVTDRAGLGDVGWGLGCAAGDYDNDGLLDLYVTNLGANVLYRNRGDGTFDDVTVDAGVGHDGFGTSTLFFDADGDGNLDLYLANYSEADVSRLPLPGERPSCVWFGHPVFCGPSGLDGASDVFYRNLGDGTFEDETKDAGLFDATGAYGLGVVTGDYDLDGDMDLYIANDSVPNFLYQNDGSGKFIEAGLYSGVAYNADGLAQAGMGVDLADLDGDGRLDLFVTNFSHDTNTVYRNAGDGVFADATAEIELRLPTWFYLGWAARFGDFDNDGDHDLFAANGHVYPQADEMDQKTVYRQQNQLFWNEGGKLVEPTWDARDGMRAEASSRGAAVGDLDDDGDLDIIIVNIDDVPSLLRNEIGGTAVTFRLVGRTSNRSALGARLTVDGRVLEVRPSGSFLSSNDPRVHVGLGDADVLGPVTIRWPSGLEQTVAETRANEVHVIVEP